MIKISLADSHQNLIKSVLKTNLWGTSAVVVAFGSRVKFTDKDTSDLDLAIKGDFKNSFAILSKLRREFEECNLPFEVDVLHYNQANPNIRNTIDADGVVFMTREELFIPEHWKVSALSETVRIISGGTPKTTVAEYWDGNIPWLSVVDFNTDFRWVEKTEKSISKIGLENSAARMLDAGDIIISARGTVGALAQLKRPMAFNQSCYGLREIAGVSDNNFLYYALRHNVAEIRQNTHGSVFDTITRATFDQLQIPLPPLPEQRAIAEVLGVLDDKIDLNRRMNETLEATARALFKSWFVDFDPVRAKAEGRPPDGLTPELADLFPSSFTDSPLGDIPTGWQVEPIGNLASCLGGSTPSTTEPAYWENGIHYWATPKDLSALNAPILWGTERLITDQALSKITSGLLPVGTILLSSRAPIGYIAIAQVPVAINQGFIGLVCDKGIPNSYIWQWVMQNMDNIKGRANGSTFMEISKAAFRPIEALLPESHVLKAFDKACQPIIQKIAGLIKQSQTLAQTRDALLPKLMSGQLRVQDAQSLVEGLA